MTTTPQPKRPSDGKGWLDFGPRNLGRDMENPDILVPPTTDSGTMPNMRYSFSDAHNRMEEGGWAREVTIRELPASDELAGVNMALAPGAYRELHWHKEAEWGLMLYGNARITAIDENGQSYIDDVETGDLWNFESGVAHSIQALDQGCEFLLVFSEAAFSENQTLLLSDWISHTPADVVAANFKKSQEELAALPKKQKYIFNGSLPKSIEEEKPYNPNGDTKYPLTLHLNDVKPVESEAGRAWILDSKVFPAAQTISGAIVEVEPGGMRELHWHPKSSEWQYYIKGQARMTVFDSNGLSRTYDYTAGDVGYVPNVAGHYVQNTGDETLVFVEVFRNPVYSDISLNKWLATTPVTNVAEHLNLPKEVVESLPKAEEPTPVVWYDQKKKEAAEKKPF